VYAPPEMARGAPPGWRPPLELRTDEPCGSSGYWDRLAGARAVGRDDGHGIREESSPTYSSEEAHRDCPPDRVREVASAGARRRCRGGSAQGGAPTVCQGESCRCSSPHPDRRRPACDKVGADEGRAAAGRKRRQPGQGRRVETRWRSWPRTSTGAVDGAHRADPDASVARLAAPSRPGSRWRRYAMIATTISSSISVNPLLLFSSVWLPLVSNRPVDKVTRLPSQPGILTAMTAVRPEDEQGRCHRTLAADRPHKCCVCTTLHREVPRWVFRVAPTR